MHIRIIAKNPYHRAWHDDRIDEVFEVIRIESDAIPPRYHVKLDIDEDPVESARVPFSCAEEVRVTLAVDVVKAKVSPDSFSSARSLSPDEERVLAALASAWDQYLKLPALHQWPRAEFMHAIHQAQYIILARPALADHAIKGKQ